MPIYPTYVQTEMMRVLEPEEDLVHASRLYSCYGISDDEDGDGNSSSSDGSSNGSSNSSTASSGSSNKRSWWVRPVPGKAQG